jgi:hypothetical protein
LTYFDYDKQELTLLVYERYNSSAITKRSSKIGFYNCTGTTFFTVVDGVLQDAITMATNQNVEDFKNSIEAVTLYSSQSASNGKDLKDYL